MATAHIPESAAMLHAAAARGGEGDAQPVGHRSRQHQVDIDQPSDHALANRRHLHARELKTESVDDVLFFRRALAFPEQGRLSVVLAEQLRLAAHLLLLNLLGKGAKASVTGLERAATGQ